MSPPGSKGTTRSFLWTGVCCIIIFTVLWQGFFPCVSYMPTGGNVKGDTFWQGLWMDETGNQGRKKTLLGISVGSV